MTVPFDLAAIDLDGTLLDRQGRISDENRQAVVGLRDAGVTVVLASGRWHGDIVDYHRQLGLRGDIVSSQGAMIKGAETRRTVMLHSFPARQARMLVQEALRVGLSVMAYRRSEVVANERSEGVRQHEVAVGSECRLAAREQSLYRNVLKLLFYGPREKLAALADGSDLSGLTVEFSRELDGVEFYPAAVTKARALEQVARTLGVPPERVATFGDGDNDVAMLRWAGTGVAMAHGSAGARQAARWVAPAGDPATCLYRAIAMVSS